MIDIIKVTGRDNLLLNLALYMYKYKNYLNGISKQTYRDAYCEHLKLLEVIALLNIPDKVKSIPIEQPQPLYITCYTNNLPLNYSKTTQDIISQRVETINKKLDNSWKTYSSKNLDRWFNTLISQIGRVINTASSYKLLYRDDEMLTALVETLIIVKSIKSIQGSNYILVTNLEDANRADYALIKIMEELIGNKRIDEIETLLIKFFNLNGFCESDIVNKINTDIV